MITENNKIKNVKLRYKMKNKKLKNQRNKK